MNVDREIAIAYLLGELAEEDRVRFEARLETDDELRHEVDELRPVVAKLETVPAEAWDPPAPPALDLARVTAPAEDRPLEVREAEFESGRRTGKRSGSPWLRVAGLLAGGLALLAIGFVIGNGRGDSDSSPVQQPGGSGQPFVLRSFGEAPKSAEGEVRMVSSEGDQMQLDVTGLKPSPNGEFYELWLLGDDGELVALGSFRVGETGSRTIEVPLPVDPAGFRYFDVSIQPENGDPQHSGRSVLRGLTSY